MDLGVLCIIDRNPSPNCDRLVPKIIYYHSPMLEREKVKKLQNFSIIRVQKMISGVIFFYMHGRAIVFC